MSSEGRMIWFQPVQFVFKYVGGSGSKSNSNQIKLKVKHTKRWESENHRTSHNTTTKKIIIHILNYNISNYIKI